VGKKLQQSVRWEKVLQRYTINSEAGTWVGRVFNADMARALATYGKGEARMNVEGGEEKRRANGGWRMEDGVICIPTKGQPRRTAEE
jgi:hypothetical protein